MQNRINNPSKLDIALIDSELKSGKEVIIQFSESQFGRNLYGKLNELCLKYDNRFSLRFYGYYSEGFDCSILSKLPNVKSLYVDCLIKASNIEAITDLQNLERLSLGIYELKETEILNSKNLKSLKDLIITETKTKALNLDHLRGYNDLELFINGGHKKNINAIGELKKLKFLSFNSVSKAPIQYINRLSNLKTLKFILGGRENINELSGTEIEELEIIRVRGFNNANNISNFNKLKSLSIEDQIQLPGVSFTKKLNHLETLRLINCKTCKSLSGLENLPNLKTLVVYKTDIDFEEFIEQLLPPNIEHLGFYTSKSKIDKEIKKKLLNRGYTDGLND